MTTIRWNGGWGKETCARCGDVSEFSHGPNLYTEYGRPLCITCGVELNPAIVSLVIGRWINGVPVTPSDVSILTRDEGALIPPGWLAVAVHHVILKRTRDRAEAVAFAEKVIRDLDDLCGPFDPPPEVEIERIRGEGA